MASSLSHLTHKASGPQLLREVTPRRDFIFKKTYEIVISCLVKLEECRRLTNFGLFR